jgi:hypothetical protein
MPTGDIEAKHLLPALFCMIALSAQAAPQIIGE